MSNGTALVHTGEPPVALQQQPSAQRAMRLLRPIAEPADVISAQEATRGLVAQALTEGRDYGKIPGVDKPTLLKPGAERVSLAFGCYARFEIVEKEVEHDREVRWVKRKKQWRNAHRGDREFTWGEESGTSLGLYRYVVRCDLIDRATGDVVGSCLGSCSTLEGKYIDRPRDCENTVIKMAEKRAHVGAVLVTFGLSEQFTQDVEDLEKFAGGEAAAPSGAAPAAPGNGKGSAKRQTPASTYPGASASDDEQLAWAASLPLRGKPDKWGGHGSKPIGEVPSNVLEPARDFFRDKAQRAEKETGTSDEALLDQVRAMELVLADRAKDQGTLEFPATGAIPPDPAGAAMPKALADEPDDGLPFN